MFFAWIGYKTSGVEINTWKCSEIRRLAVPVQLLDANKPPTPGNHRYNNLNNGGTNREEISLPAILLGASIGLAAK